MECDGGAEARRRHQPRRSQLTPVSARASTGPARGISWRRVWPFFFFSDPPTAEIYTVRNTLSLHDALPISREMDSSVRFDEHWPKPRQVTGRRSEEHTSELQSLRTISYAVFCLKKKKK